MNQNSAGQTILNSYLKRQVILDPQLPDKGERKRDMQKEENWANINAIVGR